MKAVKLFAELLGFGGFFAAILGAGAVDRNPGLGMGVMIGGAAALGVSIVVEAFSGTENEE